MLIPEDILYQTDLRQSLKLSKHGEWWHQGVKFEKRALSKLFHQSIKWDSKKDSYLLHIGKGAAEFEVEDCAFFVCELIDSELPWKVRLADDSIEELKPETLYLGSENQFYCLVKDGHRARFTRNAYQHLLNHAVDENSIAVGPQKFTVNTES